MGGVEQLIETLCKWAQTLNLAEKDFKAIVIRTKRNHVLKIKGKYDDSDSTIRE